MKEKLDYLNKGTSYGNIKIAELKDFTFHSREDEATKTIEMIKLLSLEENMLMLNLRQSKFNYTREEIESILDTKTHIRANLNSIEKDSIFAILSKNKK